MSERDEPISHGVAMRVGIACDDGTQIDLTAAVSAEDSRFLLDDTLDRLVAVGRRQRAIVRLPMLHRQREATLILLEQNQRALAEMEGAFAATMAARQARVAESEKKRSDKQRYFSDEWVASGKRGEYQPRGGQVSELAKLDSEIKIVEAEQIKANQEFETQRSQLQNDILKKEQTLSEMDADITECLRLTNGHLNGG